MLFWAIRRFGYAVGLTIVRVDQLDEWWAEAELDEVLARPSTRC